MKHRLFTQAGFEVAPHLVDQLLASNLRRLFAFSLDCFLLSIPTVVVSVFVAALFLSLTDPAALSGIHKIMTSKSDEETRLNALADIAPLLVQIDATGLPASVRVAVEKSDFIKAGELLAPYELDISLAIVADPPALVQDHIRIDIMNLIPNMVRGMALFATAALYFTLLTAGSSTGTLGKRLLGIRVVRLDERPLSYWESFERFGGYLASVGTFGLGFLDLWRDPNRRLAHDRISNTVVIRKTT